MGIKCLSYKDIGMVRGVRSRQLLEFKRRAAVEQYLEAESLEPLRKPIWKEFYAHNMYNLVMEQKVSRQDSSKSVYCFIQRIDAKVTSEKEGSSAQMYNILKIVKPGTCNMLAINACFLQHCDINPGLMNEMPRLTPELRNLDYR